MSRSILVFLLVSLLLGCSSSPPMQAVKASGKLKPCNEYATVVFMRPSYVLSAIGAELYEIEDNEISFIGGIPYRGKIFYKTTPGKKVFMAHGSAADFMVAEVEAGKVYFSVVRPNYGNQGFIPHPVRTDGTTDYNTDLPEFKSWLSQATLVEKNAESEKWYEKNRGKMREVYERYWPRFESKTDTQKAKRTLRHADGV